MRDQRDETLGTCQIMYSGFQDRAERADDEPESF